MDYLKGAGGVVWLRRVLAKLLKDGQLSLVEREAFHRRIQKVVSAAIREVRATHDDVSAHAGSVGKRVASQLWADMALPECAASPDVTLPITD
jgi:hypothetical protein